ncbi:MAG TPA: SURF1 family protein, partial [Burkholderiales bacterium]|nr:SURF1 family protein [Burkholderiales bacterium]
RGVFRAELTVLLDNKIRGHRVGYEVVTPLRLADGAHVLVNRGWFARDAKEPAPPKGEVRIEGIALERLPQALRLGEESKSRVRQNLTVPDFARETGLAFQPGVIEQHSDDGDGLLREWPRPDLGVDMHASYALQWYSLAALAVVIALALSFRKDAK